MLIIREILARCTTRKKDVAKNVKVEVFRSVVPDWHVGRSTIGSGRKSNRRLVKSKAQLDTQCKVSQCNRDHREAVQEHVTAKRTMPTQMLKLPKRVRFKRIVFATVDRQLIRGNLARLLLFNHCSTTEISKIPSQPKPNTKNFDTNKLIR